MNLTPAKAVLATAVLMAGAASASTEQADRAKLDRGRYLVVIAQCNNCHTSGYTASQGRLPESAWLLGDTRGRVTSEGTVYATNLRHFIAHLSLPQWLQVVRQGQSREPMPWWNLRAMTDEDLSAMYVYIRSLQPVGEAAPPFQPSASRMPAEARSPRVGQR